MKKLLSIVLSAIMAVSALAVSVVPAMAADTVKSPTATTVANKKPTFQVNGVDTTDIRYTVDENNPARVTFTYVGEGTLVGWEDNLENLGLIEGSDYTRTYNDDGSLTIEFISDDAIGYWENGDVLVNAIVEFDGETTTSNKVSKVDKGSKSPKTGASVTAVFCGVAAACACAAVLTAKKKDAE
ncbi:MAG: hypothetical protein NC213_01210 [Acetobacter sp.]|nr:hypothetical protein [Bacteroides sp.]MCM1340345.1 hypothetical protein [Acetobacter sp.]MCM1433008.1 hypothetical protein [Clostridiales bacterium]